MASETTPLTSGDESRTYLFLSQRHRNRRTKIRQFQCCVCAAMLGIFVTAMVVTVSYSMNHDDEDNGNSTEKETNDIEVLLPAPSGENPLKTLLSLTWPRPDATLPDWNGPMPSDLEVAAALEEGEESLKDKDLQEARAKLQNDTSGTPGILRLGTPSYMHQQAIKTTPEAVKAARVGYVIGVATEKLARKKLMAHGSVGKGPEVHAYWIPTGMTCQAHDVKAQKGDSSTECPPSPYRTMDGKCNNLVHPEWGVAMRPFRRVLPPDYADGISVPRQAKDGSYLPSARDVSVTVHRPIYRNDPKFTVMLAVWGQFFDHDITATALSKNKDGAPIACCTADGKLAKGKLHPECYPVVLSPEDPYYSEFGMTCMEFVRSAPSPTCNFGPREQLNQITSYIDASVVYGSSEEQAMRLRSPNGKGELHMMITPEGRELLPPSTDPRDGCNTPEMNKEGKYCFMSGDSRANENMHLTTMHLLLAREHNRLVRALSQINPSWDDERLYQEGRKIVSAQLQHITYNEFLPVVLGESLMDKLKLAPKQDGYFTEYNPEISPAVANHFATAAFRFAHTLLPTLMKILGNDTSSEEYIELHKILFNPYILYSANKMENALKGALNTDIQKVDTYLTPEVTQHLFQQRWSEDYDKAQEKNGTDMSKKGKKKGYGLDLASLNVQRGRDHGLPSYIKWRQHCGMSKPKSFSDLQGQMDDAALQRLATLFKSVEDVDMYSGSLSEVPIGEGLLGPTFSCLIADQFLRLKMGDRYWYETSEQPQAFTPDQLNEIRKTSLASIICDNSGVERAQQWVMRTVDPSNPRVSCTSIPRLQVEAWQDKSMVGHVKLSTPSLRARTMSKPHNLEDIKPTNKAFASTFMKGTVISASVTATDSDGNSITVLDSSLSFPKSVPAHLFDTKAISAAADGAGGMIPPFYHGGGGVTWTGTLTPMGVTQANFKGNFTVPVFKHGLTPFDFAVNSYTGDFDITLDLIGNLSITGLPVLQGTYSSGIFFQVEYASLMASPPSNEEIMESAMNDASVSGSALPQAPLLLYGSYSLDRATFNWNGNVSLILPIPSIPTLTKSIDGKNKMSKIKGSSTAVDVTATWGIVTAVTGPAPGTGTAGSKTVVTTWWDGSFPVAIPQPAFDRAALNDSHHVLPLSAAANTGGGLIWSGTMEPVPSSVTGDVYINGTYTFPVFTHGKRGMLGEPPIFTETFWRGNFSLILRPSIANKPLPLTLNLLAGGGPFKSPVFFRSSTLMEKSPTPGDYPEVASSAIPIILHGYTSLDKSIFFWTGNATLLIPKPITLTKTDNESENPEKTKGKDYATHKTLKMIKSVKLPVDVTILSGFLNMTSSPTPSIPQKNVSWNGEFPITIPQPAFYPSTPLSLTMLNTKIDVDPPYSPLARPLMSSTYKSAITWSNLTAHMVNSSATSIQINGSFSFPVFYFGGSGGKGVWKGPTIQNWTGIFNCTLNVTEDDPSAIGSVLTLISGGNFSSSVYFKNDIEASGTGDDEILRATPGETDPSSSIPEIIILVHGTMSMDKTEFYWNGEATLLIPVSSTDDTDDDLMLTAVSSLKGAVYTNRSYITGNVVSGNVMASSSKGQIMWWNGELPLPIAMPPFDIISPNAGMYTWPYDPTIYNGTGGITWSGKMTTTSINRLNVKGSFSVPVFIHGNPSAFEVEEWSGDFSLDIKVNFNHTGDGSQFMEGKYNSPVFFREQYPKYTNNIDIITDISNQMASPSSYQLGSSASLPLPRVPLILWGNYSNDTKTFYWQGNISAIFIPVPKYITSLAKAITSDSGMKRAFDIYPELFKEKRIRLAIKVISGSITASSASFSSKALWDGTLPFNIKSSIFQKYSDDTSFIGGPITWTGHFALADSVTNRAHMEGSFSIPILTKSNSSAMTFETWTGDFSFLISFNSSENLMDILPSNGPFLSRIILGISYPTPMESLETKSDDSLEVKINEIMESIETPGSDSAPYSMINIPTILLGDFSADRNTFAWNGEAVVYIPEKPSSLMHKNILGKSRVIKPAMSRSDSFKNKKTRQRKINGWVTSGQISGGTHDSFNMKFWNGDFPARIPLPAFDRYSRDIEEFDQSSNKSRNVHGGVTWKVSHVSPKGNGLHMQGHFLFPIFIHGKHNTLSVAIWKGRFSFDAMLAKDQSIYMLRKNQKYRSRIYFHEDDTYWNSYHQNTHTDDDSDWNSYNRNKHTEDDSDWNSHNRNKHTEDDSDWNSHNRNKHTEDDRDWNSYNRNKNTEDDSDWNSYNQNRQTDDESDWNSYTQNRHTEDDSDWNSYNRNKHTDNDRDWNSYNRNKHTEDDRDLLEAVNNLGARGGRRSNEDFAIIILKGKHQKSEFFWSGKFVVIFKNNS